MYGASFMKLIGSMRSPYVRRVAISARFLGIEYTFRELSTFRNKEVFEKINPLLKVPTVICDDETVLVDSSVIIDYMETLAKRRLLPSTLEAQVKVFRLSGIALIAMEKIVQIIYETEHRPERLQYQDWKDRIEHQLRMSFDLLEGGFAKCSLWVAGDAISQADISTAIVWRFAQEITPEIADAADYPNLSEFSKRAERLEEFSACPL